MPNDTENLNDTYPGAGTFKFDIAANWDGTPALVIRTTKVSEVRFCDVTEEMALMEGENDSLVGWRKAHKAFFKRNGGYDPEMLLIRGGHCHANLRGTWPFQARIAPEFGPASSGALQS